MQRKIVANSRIASLRPYISPNALKCIHVASQHMFYDPNPLFYILGQSASLRIRDDMSIHYPGFRGDNTHQRQLQDCARYPLAAQSTTRHRRCIVYLNALQSDETVVDTGGAYFSANVLSAS